MANKVSFLIQFKDQFSKNTEKLKRQMKGIDHSVKKANSSFQKLSIRVKESLSSMGKSATKAGAIMTAAITVPAGLLGKSMINAASDAEETANKFAEVFKGIGSESSKAVNDLKTNFKLATSTSQELLSSTGDLLVGLGLTREEALALSVDVVKLSADVASFKNVQGGTERASIALTKALLGEREMLKETFKTAILEEEVKKRAAIISRKNRKLTEQQAKAMAVLAIVTERNKDAIGDFNRTQEAYANQVRISQEKTKELRESFGRLMLPIATKFIKILTKFFDWLNKLSKPMKTLVLIITAFAVAAGPLLLIIGGISVGLAAISVAALPVIAAIGALSVAAFMLWSNWDGVIGGLKAIWNDFKNFILNTINSIGEFFDGLWFNLKSGFVNFVNFAITLINSLLAPLDFVASKLGFGSIKIDKISSTPSTPTQNMNGSFSGELTVAAETGTKVRRGRSRNRGSSNIGMNMVTQ